MSDDQKSHADLIREQARQRRAAAGLNPDKRPATREEISRACAIKDKDMAIPGTEEHDMREARLAEIEERRPVYRRGR